MASIANLPTPGQEKIVSIMTAPPSNTPKDNPTKVIIGTNELLRTCLNNIILPLIPLAFAPIT